MGPIDRIRGLAPASLRRSELRRRVAGSRWLRSAPPRHLKDLAGALACFPSAVALTFDDGPDPHITPQLLRLLARHGARATFFICGLAARRHPDIVRTIAAEGHGVGAHGWDHRPLLGLPDGELRRQVDRPLALLDDLTGRHVRWFRPPWGAAAPSTVDDLRRRGVATMLWSAEGLDWHLTDPAAIVMRTERDLDTGGVILLHDAVGDLLSGDGALPSGVHGDRRPTIDATDLLLRRARTRGVRFVSLDDLPPAPVRGRTTLQVPVS